MRYFDRVINFDRQADHVVQIAKRRDRCVMRRRSEPHHIAANDDLLATNTIADTSTKRKIKRINTIDTVRSSGLDSQPNFTTDCRSKVSQRESDFA